MSPFPKTWPEALRNWTPQSIVDSCPIFQITGHPAFGGHRYGAVRVGQNTLRWVWIVGRGLNTNLPPWDDEGTYEPQCPALLGETGGEYPCAVEGTPWDIIRASLGCREIGMPEFLEAERWLEYLVDHPLCSLDYQPAP
jgi:hypothetical protein